MKSGLRVRRFKLVGSAILILMGVMVAIKVGRQPAETAPPVTILTEPFVIPVTARDRLRFTFSFSPLADQWASRLEKTLFGARKSININGDFFSISGYRLTDFESILGLGKPTFAQSNGLHIWFLEQARFLTVSQRLSQVPEINFMMYPRVVAAEGTISSVFTGQSISLNGSTNNVGLSIEYYAKGKEQVTELVTTISQSELVTKRIDAVDGVEATNAVRISTNMDVRAQLEIPRGSGVLLIQIPREEGKVFGALIHPLR
jgi:hypothetical protein